MLKITLSRRRRGGPGRTSLNNFVNRLQSIPTTDKARLARKWIGKVEEGEQVCVYEMPTRIGVPFKKLKTNLNLDKFILEYFKKPMSFLLAFTMKQENLKKKKRIIIMFTRLWVAQVFIHRFEYKLFFQRICKDS